MPDQPLPPGEYFWQVATRSAEGEIGPFSDPQPFTRLEPAPVPEPAVANATDRMLVVQLPRAVEDARTGCSWRAMRPSRSWPSTR